MKKLFITIAAVLLGASLAFAQDLATVTEAYNNGLSAFQNGDQQSALKQLQQALIDAEALGDEGAEIVSNCKTAIPGVALSIAKDFTNNQDYDKAVEYFELAKTLAGTYGEEEIAAQATDLIPQVLMQKANGLLNDKDYAAAAESYKAVLAADPTNGAAALRLGAALNSAGDKDGAIEAFKTAIENGQESAASKQISNIYLKDAAAALKAKKYGEAVDAALKVNEYGENAKAYQIAGQASQSQGKAAQAITYFEKYLELSPNAANAGQIAYTIGALAQQSGNKAKALEFYKKAVANPSLNAQLKAEAQKQINALN